MADVTVHDTRELLDAISKDLAVMKAQAEASNLLSLASSLDAAMSEALDLSRTTLPSCLAMAAPSPR